MRGLAVDDVATTVVAGGGGAGGRTSGSGRPNRSA
jgi:hypothetical protein